MLNSCQASTHMRIAGEGKSLVAVTHLALLGVKRQEPAFWDDTKEKSSPMDCFFECKFIGEVNHLKKNIWNNLTKSQRIQMKSFICILGIILLIILIIANGINKLNGIKVEEEPVHHPVFSSYKNVWIMEETQDSIQCYIDGTVYNYYFDEEYIIENESLREQIADIELKDNRIISITTKKEKINDKVLIVTSDYKEFENLGRYSIDSNIKGYRLYNTLIMFTLPNIPMGYSIKVFCVRDNKICAI